MNFRETRARRRSQLVLELTPLIDVVFLLLLFFLITTTFVRDTNKQLPLDLPSASAGEATSDNERIVIFVTADGSLQINDEIVRPNEVKARLEKLYADDANTQLLIKGDKATSYGHVTDIIDLAKGVGFERVNLVVKPKQ